MVETRGFPNRSHALAEMIRSHLAEHERDLGTTMLAGAITIVYKNSGDNVRTRLTKIQRKYIREVITSQHVFLEEDQGLEVLLVQGPGRKLQRLCDELIACRGVSQAHLTSTTTLLPPLH